MTEQEAKTKWCPMRRIIRIGDVRIDNTDGQEFTLSCIGSACMMWRWKHHRLGDNPMVTVHADGTSTTDAPKPEQGGCGLAGPI